jgi:hypothetical protein
LAKKAHVAVSLAKEDAEIAAKLLETNDIFRHT